MKNTILKKLGGTMLAILMLTAFTQISVSAQEDGIFDNVKSAEQTQEEDLATQRNNTRKLEGSWNIQVTGRSCATGDAIRTFPSMFTIHRGGTMSEWGSGNPPATRGLGHGVWNYESRNRYASAFQFFRFNADGTHAGRQVIRQQIRLSNDGNSFTSSAVAQVFDANGNVIQTNCSTGAATRFE
jgi:hypothetical protein